ncbi:MAG: PP2C family protein-serine/threonine phosphatase [Candidatus Baltobacteraceae bacterium]
MTRTVAAGKAGYKWFEGRFFRGTSPWNAPFLLFLPASYFALSAVLRRTKLRPHVRTRALTGLVASFAVSAVFYYGRRQSRMTAALADEKARADMEHQLADSLQEAFVQQRLPAVSNLGFSATYLPSAVSEKVGGDWYDAFELPHGRIMFCIGDVVGHGVEAAVRMSKARQAIVIAALHEDNPGSILARANTSLMLEETAFATAICGYVDARTLEVTYATAGHPPAILVASDGSASLLNYGGLPLGVQADARYRTFHFTAEPESVLVLYTDGLIEYDRNLIEGERRVLEIAREIGRRKAKNPAAEIQDAIFAQYEPLDDVAILTITFRDGAQHEGNDRERWSVGLRGVRTPFTDG